MSCRQLICTGLLALAWAVALPAMADGVHGTMPGIQHPGGGAGNTAGPRVKPRTGDGQWRTEDPIDDKEPTK